MTTRHSPARLSSRLLRTLSAATLLMVSALIPGVGAQQSEPTDDPGHTATSTPTADVQPPSSENGVRAQRRIVVDPESGRILSGEPGTGPSLSRRTRNALSRSHAGLVEEVLPSGAVAVDLQGRFRSVLVARVDESGQLVTHHPVVAVTEEADLTERSGERP